MKGIPEKGLSFLSLNASPGLGDLLGRTVKNLNEDNRTSHSLKEMAYSKSPSTTGPYKRMAAEEATQRLQGQRKGAEETEVPFLSLTK